MKKLLSILITLTLVLGLTAAFAFESSAAGIVSIYEAAKDPVVDGVVDSEGYRLVCKTGADTTGYLNTWEGCTVDDTMELWACWKGDFLYIAIKVVCNGEHVAYMDNAGEHFIFNAHHLMTCICPDDPYKDCYVGDNEDGSWSWGGLYNKQFIYEWTIINPSQETESDIADHFCAMSGLEGFEYKVVTDGGYDVYEQKIPLSKMTTSEAPNGVKGQVGSLFGFGFQIGLSDYGNGYANAGEERDYDDYVFYSDYFTGAKKVVGMSYCKLVSDIAKDPGQEESTTEPQAPTAIDTVCDIFPTLDGLWVKTDVEGDSINIEYSQGKTVINGSTAGKWPSAKAVFPNPVYIGEGTYLVYDLSFDVGKTSFRLNGENYVHKFMSDNLEAGTSDLLPGSYSGAISYEQLVELLGANEDGLVAITDMTVFTVDGAEITVNTFKLDPAYVPPVVEPDDPSEAPSEDPGAESEPEDESVPTTESTPVVEDSTPADDSDGGNTGLIIGIVAGVVAIIAIVVVVVILKKKKA
ncbi:MAG: hypothetical protein E7674_04885 [Ruminococcaceae bacterium]|nr:hypothetical protein [Oscillospiraceae bacterium]